MTKWRLTPAARADLVQIWHYSDEQWGEDQAEAYVRQIKRDLAIAAKGSPLARRFDDIFKLRSGRHLCIYRPLPDGTIEVLRILHERMDIDGEIAASKSPE